MTLPELNSRLLAERLNALVIVPASIDPDDTDLHFPEGGRYPNGSTVRILRGRPGPRQLQGFVLDVAMVFVPLPVETMDEVRRRLLSREGVLFAPFEPAAP